MKFVFLLILTFIAVSSLEYRRNRPNRGHQLRRPQRPLRGKPSAPSRNHSPKPGSEPPVKTGWGASGWGWNDSDDQIPKYNKPPPCKDPSQITVVPYDTNFFYPSRVYYYRGITKYGAVVNARVLLGRYPASQKELNQMCPVQVFGGNTPFLINNGYGRQNAYICPGDIGSSVCTTSLDPTTYDQGLGVNPSAGFTTQALWLVATDNSTFTINYMCNDGTDADIQMFTTTEYASPAQVQIFKDVALQYGFALDQLQISVCKTPYYGDYPSPFQNYPNSPGNENNGWGSNNGWNEPNGWNQQPNGWNQQPNGWNSQPTGWNSQPSGWNSHPSGWNSQPSGWNSQPSGWNSQPSGWNPQPTGWNQPSQSGWSSDPDYGWMHVPDVGWTGSAPVQPDNGWAASPPQLDLGWSNNGWTGSSPSPPPSPPQELGWTNNNGWSGSGPPQDQGWGNNGWSGSSPPQDLGWGNNGWSGSGPPQDQGWGNNNGWSGSSPPPDQGWGNNNGWGGDPALSSPQDVGWGQSGWSNPPQNLGWVEENHGWPTATGWAQNYGSDDWIEEINKERKSAKAKEAEKKRVSESEKQKNKESENEKKSEKEKETEAEKPKEDAKPTVVKNEP